MAQNQEHQRDKYLVVSVDALFELPKNAGSFPSVANSFPLAVSALEKAYKQGWKIYFWSWRDLGFYVALMKVLQDLKVWDLCDPVHEETLLMRRVHKDKSKEHTMLSLLEARFGRNLDEGNADIAIVEIDELLANEIQSYVSDRLQVHLAPRVWLNIMALSLDKLDPYLTFAERKKVEPGT